MHGKRVIRLGDPTSHGGVVVSATSNFIMFGKPVALVGDNCTCPKKGHDHCVIMEGDPTWTFDGRGVALEGCKLSCGAVLISTLPHVTRSYEGEGSAFGGAATGGIENADAMGEDIGQENPERFELIDEITGETITDDAYRMDYHGQESQGATDGQGVTPPIKNVFATQARFLIRPETVKEKP